MNKRIFWIVLLVLASTLLIFGLFEETRAFMVALFLRVLLFVKKNLFSMLAAFFLVKGKFMLTIFMKKIALLSATGLGKRYVVEKVVMGNVKKHFFNHLSDDIKRLIQHAKKNFKSFPLVKKIITIFAFLGSLGFVGKFMGGMLALKVFVAKIWSFLLAIFLKTSTAVVYFFTDYLWDSWLAPIIEVVIFSWILSWMEKIPFLAKGLKKIYTFFISFFEWFEYYMEKIFHVPLKVFLKWLVKKIQRLIYRFIGYEKVSKWKRLKEDRALNPNSHTKLETRRKERKEIIQVKVYISARERLMRRRKAKK